MMTPEKHLRDMMELGFRLGRGLTMSDRNLETCPSCSAAKRMYESCDLCGLEVCEDCTTHQNWGKGYYRDPSEDRTICAKCNKKEDNRQAALADYREGQEEDRRMERKRGEE